MDPIRLDVLREVGNVGASHAITALSKMLDGQKLELVIPEACWLSFEDAAKFMSEDSERLVVGIYMHVSGDVQGHMAFLLPLDSAMLLIRRLTSERGDALTEMALSTLQEIGNIMITSYLNALNAMTDLVLHPSVPGVAVDMTGAIWQSVLAGAQVAEQVTFIKTEFRTAETPIGGHIIFLPADDDFQRIAAVLGARNLP